jgi:hypothetical protein
MVGLPHLVWATGLSAVEQIENAACSHLANGVNAYGPLGSLLGSHREHWPGFRLEG